MAGSHDALATFGLKAEMENFTDGPFYAPLSRQDDLRGLVLTRQLTFDVSLGPPAPPTHDRQDRILVRPQPQLHLMC